MPFKTLRSFFVAALFVLFYASLPGLLHAGTSRDIPVDNRIYNYLERLEVRGFIESSHLSTRPFSRLEGARLYYEALNNWNTLSKDRKEDMTDVPVMLRKLQREFRSDIEHRGYFKPLDRSYLGYLYGDSIPDHMNTNNNGDNFKEGQNVRIGFASALKLWDSISFSINPEIRESDDASELKVIHGYGILSHRNLEVEIGRESMWWGPGFHGGLLLTDNAEPFDMIRLTSQVPFLLPSMLGRLGPLKPTFFVTELEEDRHVSGAKLIGMRFDLRPHPSFRFALSRVIMFDGEGRKRSTLSDWLRILFEDDNAGYSDSSIDNNNIMSLDFSLIINVYHRMFPFDGLKFYGEIGVEDSSRIDRLKENAVLTGFFVEDPFWLNNIGLRVEWASTAINIGRNPWYTHSVYETGYSYKGRIIGHHMGTDAEDLFARMEYYTGIGANLGVESDIERMGIHSGSVDTRKWYGIDFTYPLLETLDLSLGYGYEDFDERDESTYTIWSRMEWSL